MADKTISSLPEATALDAESLMVTEQLGEARRVTGQLLADYAKAAAQEEAEKASTYAQSAAESAQTAGLKAQEAQNVATKPPYIQGENWWIWNEEAGAYTDSGIDASVSLAVADTVTGAPGTEATVENIGTSTDLLLRFTIPRGDKGEVGSVNSVNAKTGEVVLAAQDIPIDPPAGESGWTDTALFLNGLHGKETAIEESKGQPGGIATLDLKGKLSQMPTAADVGARPNTWTPTASDVGAISAEEKGAAGGVAALDPEGKLMHAHAAGFKLGVSQGGTGASDPVNARANLGIVPQSVLWSGNDIMPAGRAITLSAPVSAQNNGIVLVFSASDGDESNVKDYDYLCYFVPKTQISLHSGKGHDFAIYNVSWNSISAKYLYLHDTTIVGNVTNDKSGTGSTGITYDNKKAALRHVIGV